uniref:Uncharacterized protein n=1 Tax=Panagrellus redivivus TaxID=6233 RepID=A0A7E4W083_PANRE
MFALNQCNKRKTVSQRWAPTKLSLITPTPPPSARHERCPVPVNALVAPMSRPIRCIMLFGHCGDKGLDEGGRQAVCCQVRSRSFEFLWM